MKAGFWVDFGPVMFSIELFNWKVSRYEDEFIVIVHIGPVEYTRYKNVPEKSTP
jgi:hypothetical protein